MFKFALRNLFRQKLRTLMTLSAIVFGVSGLILSGGFVQDLYVQLGEMLIHSQTGHLQVTKAGFYAEGARKPEQYLLKDLPSLKAQVAPVPGVANVLFRLNFSGLVNNGRTDLPVLGEGVDPDLEAKLGSSLMLIAGRRLTNSDARGVALGAGVAKALKVKPGDRTTLVVNTIDGAMNTLEFEVIGVFQTFSKDFDARAIRIPLAAAQELLTVPAANAMVIELANTEDTVRIQQELTAKFKSQGLEVKNWIELNDFYEKTVKLYEGQFGVLRLIILMMVLLSVVNSVNMTVMERVGEFGTLMALGNRSAEVFKLVLTESTLLGFFGAVLGAIAGIVLAALISAIGIPMPPPPSSDLGYVARIQLTPWLVISALLVGFFATVLAAILPARHVSRRPVVDALRQNI